MLYYWDRACHQVFRFVDHLSPQEWLIALAIVTVLGFVLLRGFGSRSSY
jgi:hypothetical protein